MPDEPLELSDNSPRFVVCGLDLLRQVHSFADEFQRSPWDFAVEITSLRIGGLTNNDLRWLVLNGYLEHAQELPIKQGKTRQFTRFGSLTFTRRSCFIPLKPESWLTERRPPQGMQAPADGNGNSSAKSPSTEFPVRPTWDAAEQQLRLGQEVVKNFKHPSVCQTAILSAFQEANWPTRIDNPLSKIGLNCPQMHLREAIESLNLNQRKPLIHFAPDESGRGVFWSYSEHSV